MSVCPILSSLGRSLRTSNSSFSPPPHSSSSTLYFKDVRWHRQNAGLSQAHAVLYLWQASSPPFYCSLSYLLIVLGMNAQKAILCMRCEGWRDRPIDQAQASKQSKRKFPPACLCGSLLMERKSRMEEEKKVHQPGGGMEWRWGCRDTDRKKRINRWW